MKNINLIFLTIILFGCAQKEEKTERILTSNLHEQHRVTAEDSLALKNIINIQSRSGNLEERGKIWAEDGRWLQAFGRVFYGKDTITSFEKHEDD